MATEPAVQLLALAERGLADAVAEPSPVPRFTTAHLAALRAAAAVLAARALPDRSASAVVGSRPRSAWGLLAGVAPELGEWAQFFAASAPPVVATARGVTVREADDMVRQVGLFVPLAQRAASSGARSAPPQAVGGAHYCPVV